MNRLTVIAAVALILCLAVQPAAADEESTIQLVQHPDGRLAVVTGTQFADAGAVVLAEEPDMVMRIAGVGDYLDPATGEATDHKRPWQWGLDLLQAESAWSRANGAGQTIAIIDTGVDASHPDLNDRLVDGYSATGRDELDDRNGHGTHVAGIAAASLGERYGVVGVAPTAALMSVQVANEFGAAYTSAVAEGIIWAVDHDADVINLSLGGTQESLVVNGAIDHAVANDVVVVVAAGNWYERGNPISWPAAHPDVIAVGGLLHAQRRDATSSTGDWLDLTAPGRNILSSLPPHVATVDGGWGWSNGTSMAAPAVAGAAALVWSAAPDLTAAEVQGALLYGARDIGDPGRDDEFGFGRLDVNAALDLVAPTWRVPPACAWGSGGWRCHR